MILMKLTDVLQAVVKETKDIDEIHAKNVNKRNVTALQYPGGHVISNSYRKLKNLKLTIPRSINKLFL